MRIAVYGSEYQDGHFDSISRLFDSLSHYNAWVEIESSFYDYLCSKLPAPPVVNDVITDNDFSAAIALSIGGDGTFLRTTQWVAHKGIPILGINTGHLGYLTGADMSDIDEVIKELFSDRYKIETRTMLQVTNNAGVKFEHPYALNEVTVLKQDTSAMLTMHASVNGTDLTSYLGDGLILSTPTGSTAYNLSVGGPIMEPSTHCWVLSPISPHSLTMRPVVLRDDTVVKITTKSRVDLYRVSIDGRSFSCPSGSSIEVSKAPFSAKVIQRLNHNFADTPGP
jgi:NAD+ kinase